MVTDKQKLYDLLNRPGLIKSEDAEFLQALIKKYPYFQAPQVLYLKYLKHYHPVKYKKKLPVVASVTTDRAFLFDFIHDYTEVPLDEQIQEPAPADRPDAQSQTPEEFHSVPEEKHPEMPPENMSYLDWVKYLSGKRTSLGPQKISQDAKRKKRILIDKFLNEQPKIKPDKNFIPKPLPEAEASLRENRMLMTETLAELLVKQGKYEKAIRAFEILKLKYPEKNRYFASRISEVKSLLNKKNN